jgi:hypothetical protein
MASTKIAPAPDARTAAEKLISIRHHCFVRGILARHPEGDFLAAFRDVNRLYVEIRRQARTR